jgi:glyoxylase I family protein
MPAITGVSHVILAVCDLARSAEWYERTLGAQKLMEMELFPGHNIVLYLAGPLLVGIHHDERHDPDDRFDEFRVGLDHVSFLAQNRAEVEAWASKLDGLGVEHSPIADEPYGHVLVFRDPDNIQLEFMAQPDTERGPAPDDAPAVRGLSHIGLTVTDVDRSAEWYKRVLGLGDSVVSMREASFAFELFGVADTFGLGIASNAATPDGDRFSEFRCGLDHLAFGCADRAEVDSWAAHLDEIGVEHSPIQDAPYGRVLVFRDPDNIQLELFAQ